MDSNVEKPFKKIYFLGDSITEGWGASTPEKSYVSLFAQRHKEMEVFNYGRWGTRIARQKTPSESQCMDEDFNTRVAQMPEGADVVIVFGGTNDFGHGDAQFGSLNDDTEWTFCGALNCLFKKLIGKFPKSKIIVMTPLHRDDEALPNMHGKCLIDYVSAIREIADRYSLEVLDLFNCSGIEGQVSSEEKNYLLDGLHPNDAGHYRIFTLLDTFLKGIQ